MRILIQIFCNESEKYAYHVVCNGENVSSGYEFNEAIYALEAADHVARTWLDTGKTDEELLKPERR